MVKFKNQHPNCSLGRRQTLWKRNSRLMRFRFTVILLLPVLRSSRFKVGETMSKRWSIFKCIIIKNVFKQKKSQPNRKSMLPKKEGQHQGKKFFLFLLLHFRFLEFGSRERFPRATRPQFDYMSFESIFSFSSFFLQILADASAVQCTDHSVSCITVFGYNNNRITIPSTWKQANFFFSLAISFHIDFLECRK